MDFLAFLSNYWIRDSIKNAALFRKEQIENDYHLSPECWGFFEVETSEDISCLWANISPSGGKLTGFLTVFTIPLVNHLFCSFSSTFTEYI